jgi:hypothetical protein
MGFSMDVAVRLPGHECNAFCRHPVHAETASSFQPAPVPSCWQPYYGRHAARVLSVSPAEMPPEVVPDVGVLAYHYLVMVELMTGDELGWYRPGADQG